MNVLVGYILYLCSLNWHVWSHVRSVPQSKQLKAAIFVAPVGKNGEYAHWQRRYTDLERNGKTAIVMSVIAASFLA